MHVLWALAPIRGVPPIRIITPDYREFKQDPRPVEVRAERRSTGALQAGVSVACVSHT